MRFGARSCWLLATVALALTSCSRDALHEEIATATENEESRIERMAEIAPSSLKIVVTPEATSDDKTTLEKNVEYKFRAIYMEWGPGPVPLFEYTITKGDLVTPGYIRNDPTNGVMKVTFTKPGLYKITLRCLNYPNNVRSRTFNVHEDIVPWDSSVEQI